MKRPLCQSMIGSHYNWVNNRCLAWARPRCLGPGGRGIHIGSGDPYGRCWAPDATAELPPDSCPRGGGARLRCWRPRRVYIYRRAGCTYGHGQGGGRAAVGTAAACSCCHGRPAAGPAQLAQGAVCWRRPPRGRALRVQVGSRCCMRRREMRRIPVLNPSITLGSARANFLGAH